MSDAGLTDAGGALDGPATFTYVPVDGTVCANGSTAGYGASDSPTASNRLVVFYMGGGACWDGTTCFVLGSAAHLSTNYSQTTLNNDMTPLVNAGLTDRGDAELPYRDAHMAFLPYCTADIHAGDVVRYYPYDIFNNMRAVHHKGRPNTVAWVAELAARYPDVDEVLIAGFSAGGYGGIVNFDVFTAAFPNADVHVLVDGSPFVEPQSGLYFTWKSTWDMAIPAGCTDCDTSFEAILARQRADHPDSRFALVSSTNDETIRLFFGFGLNDMTAHTTGVVDRNYDDTNGRAFFVTGQQHVLLVAYNSFTAPGGPTLKSWYDAWVAGDDAGWVQVRP